MRINSSQNFFNVSGINQKSIENPSNARNSIEPPKNPKLDFLSISPKGRSMSMIETLTKQKEHINERKNELIGTTIENGGNLTDIQERLDSIDMQLQDIDKQISDIMTESAEDLLEDNKSVENHDDTPKTEQEIEDEELEAISNFSVDIDNIEIVLSEKREIERKIDKILNAQDGPLTSNPVAELQSDLKELTSDVFGRLSDVAEELENITDSEIIIKDDNKVTDSTNDNEVTDSTDDNEVTDNTEDGKVTNSIDDNKFEPK